MKKILVALAVVFGFTEAVAQQTPLYSQYLFNDYAINPAVGGSRPYYDVKSNHRYQWIGVTDSPRTYTLSMHGPNKTGKMGLGFLLYTDIVGPTRRTGIQFSYSYHLQLSDATKLSLGVSAGVQQFMIDASKITLRDPDDNVFSAGLQSALVPDAKFGAYLYHDKYFVSISLPQIIQNKLYFFEEQSTTGSQLEDHYYAAAGYKFDLSDDFQVEPSVMVKYVDPAPIQFDFMGRIIYRDAIWVGGAFRTDDAISTMIGYVYRQNLMFGYSYDITTTNLKNYSDGTHEIMIGVRFITKRLLEQGKSKTLE